MLGKGCGQPRIKARETLEMTSKVWARITVRPGCHSRNKELWRGTGFVGEMMSSVRHCWIWGNGKTFKWKWQVGSQTYGNKPWARVRTRAVNLWVISPMCLQAWERRWSLRTVGPPRRVEDQGQRLGQQGTWEGTRARWETSGELESHQGNKESIMLEIRKDENFPRRSGWKCNGGYGRENVMGRENGFEKDTGRYKGNWWFLEDNLGKKVGMKIRFQRVKEKLGREQTHRIWTIYFWKVSEKKVES